MSATVTPTAGAVERGDFADALAGAALELARGIAAGAVLWCVAPGDHRHAEHVAVEFLHPVIMGKRAVAARALRTTEADAVLRTTARSGDALVLLGPSDRALEHLVRRARPWGLTSFWLTSDMPRPGELPVDHVVRWADHDADDDVDLVMTYHLLWELTHVVFEHPGLLTPEPAPTDGDAACALCADEGRVAEVSEQEDGRATVRVDGDLAVVDTALVGSVAPGDLVLIHAGVAITRIEEP
jgi:hypothetical protein